MKPFTLAGFSVERRIAAIAQFRCTNLEDLQTRNLPSDISKASGSVRQLATRSFEQWEPEFVAISLPFAKAGKRVRSFCDIAKEVANTLGIPTIEVEDRTLMSAYGHPALKRKEHVRRVGRAIWPSLNSSKSRRAAVDASTVGLYVQTERLFSQCEAEE